MTKEEYQNYTRSNNIYEILYAYYSEKTKISLKIQDFIDFFTAYINFPILHDGRVYNVNPQNITNSLLVMAKNYFNNKFK